MRRIIALIMIFSSLFSLAGNNEDFTKYVNQYIGTGGHGHVFLGANVPFGFVQVGPTQIPQTWDWCSGYNITDSTIIGFSHTHLSGTGIGDLADVTLMPVIGDVKFERGNENDTNSGLWSYFKRENEIVEPGYYATVLERYNIKVELTATSRAGFQKYIFPKSCESAVVVNLESGTCWDNPTDCDIVQVDSVTFVGHRHSKGWANNQKIYFAMKFSRPVDSFKTYRSKGYSQERNINTDIVYARMNFKTQDNDVIYVKTGLSACSEEGALLNLNTEIPDWNFEKIKSDAKNSWNERLGRIEVSTSDKDQKIIFYTALFHTMIAPSLFCDVNGDYRGADGEKKANPGHKTYTTFSLWDTYRAQHPLMTIIHQEMVDDIINSMLNIFDEQGKLPVWHLMGCETNCMHGNPAICVISDAILKGYKGFDVDRAYDAMKKTAMLDERGLNFLKKYGYIPYDMINEGLTKCMEYNIADGALAKVAAFLGKKDDALYFLERSHSYRKYYDNKSGFIRGLSSKGEWRTPFDPFVSVHRVGDYSEGNAWQYTWLAPHDLKGMENLFGGKRKMEKKLDSLFVAKGDIGEQASPDITGLIGQYVHGNEPSHHIAYLYNYIGRPNKTADVVREVFDKFYFNDPNGLCGNEDVGQMSAWAVLSYMGFYQIEPAGGRYYFGTPMFEYVNIQLKNGKTFRIEAPHTSDSNRYIKSVTLNGKPYRKNYIDYTDIVSGGILHFNMTDK